MKKEGKVDLKYIIRFVMHVMRLSYAKIIQPVGSSNSKVMVAVSANMWQKHNPHFRNEVWLNPQAHRMRCHEY